MQVTVPNGTALRMVAKAVAPKSDPRYYIHWIFLDLDQPGAPWLVATDGHVMARTQVEVRYDDAKALVLFLAEHVRKEPRTTAAGPASFLFRLSGAIPQRWDGHEVLLDFATERANTPVHPGTPLFIEMAPPSDCCTRYPDWRRVDAHLRPDFGWNPHGSFQGAFGLDFAIVARVCPTKVKVEIQDESSPMRITPLGLENTFLTLMPMHP